MPAKLSQLPSLLARDQLAPVWLIAGSEHLLVIEAADALRRRARELGYAEREVHDVDPQFDWNELSRAAGSMSLFSSRKLIDLRLPTGKPGKDGAAAIIEYCDVVPADTILLITCHDWGKAHEAAWSAAIDRVGVHMVAWPVKRDELPGWIGQRLASRGLKPTPDAVALLAERVEGNLLAAAQEIDKLVLLVGDRPLDVQTLEDCVADDARYDAFRLTDAAFAGDAKRALQIVDGLRNEGEELVPLMGWISSQLRGVLRSGSGAGRGYDPRQATYQRALKSAPASHWECCMQHAALIDRTIKGRGDIESSMAMGLAWRELSRLVAAMAAPRQAAGLLVD